MPPLLIQLAGGFFIVPAALLLAACVAINTQTKRKALKILCTAMAVLAAGVLVVSPISLPLRRYLASLLANPAATSDGIHLSNTGQQLLEELVWKVVGPGFATHSTTSAASGSTPFQ